MSVKAVVNKRPAVIESVTLTMTEEHARVLRTLLRQVAGHPDDTARRLFDEIEESLASVGVEVCTPHKMFHTVKVWLRPVTKGAFK